MPRPAALLARVLDQLPLAVFVFEDVRLVYANTAGAELADRLRVQDRIELRVVLLDHLRALDASKGAGRTVAATVTLLTSHSGEPFYVRIVPVEGRRARTPAIYAVTVRSRATDVPAFGRRYRLSAREAQIVELILRGAGNREIAQTLGITIATAKKHLGRIFDKVGVDSRSQLMAKLA
jgi:DNA-binding CsgD family transcriptional regulator